MKFIVTVIVLFCVVIAGCALPGGFESSGGLGIDASKMSADQIKAAAGIISANKEKDTGIRCVKVNTPYGMGTVVELNMDTAGRLQGKATVQPDCTMTVESDSRPPVK